MSGVVHTNISDNVTKAYMYLVTQRLHGVRREPALALRRVGLAVAAPPAVARPLVRLGDDDDVAHLLKGARLSAPHLGPGIALLAGGRATKGGKSTACSIFFLQGA